MNGRRILGFIGWVIGVGGGGVWGQDWAAIAESYRPVVERIIAAGREENDAYVKLQELCDDIGHRISGSEGLERAVEWAQQTLRDDGMENVRAEPVMVRKWVRGEESCELIAPRPQRISMLGLGGSVGTPAEGIEAPIVVVRDKQELDALPDDRVRGHIVVFNSAMPPYSEANGSGYGTAVEYRVNGAVWASERGAVAALLRSVTATSLDSPHTGMMRYRDAEQRIPFAAISIEAAEMLARLQARGVPSAVRLKMAAEDQGEVPSANVIGEWPGREFPEEYVVVGGHLDSWDVGQGAQDDGAGCVAALEAVNLLRRLDLRPRRTIRVVLWTNEENGLAGARAYAALHQHEIHVAGIESDSGAFAPRGFTLEMHDDRLESRAAEQLSALLRLLEPIGATRAQVGGSGADVGQLKTLGTLCLGLDVDGSRYFNTHHTWADTIDKIDPHELSDCVIALAATAYLLADVPVRLGDE